MSMGWTYTNAILGKHSSSSKKIPKVPSDLHVSTKVPNPIRCPIQTRELSLQRKPPSLLLAKESYSQNNPTARINSILGSATKKSSSTQSSIKIETTPVELLKVQPTVIIEDTNEPKVRPTKRAIYDNEDPLRKKSRVKPERTAEESPLGQVIYKRTFKKLSSKYTSIPLSDLNYKLKYVIKGCDELTKDTAASAKTWLSDFEPNSDIVAIGGLRSILFLDSNHGQYLNKYTHKEVNEIFYTMSWTQLSHHETKMSVLAVAGYLGSIKLLNTTKNECYRCLFGHRRSILALTFSKKQPTWLFSASEDHTVRLWDIGSLDFNNDDSLCLAKFTLPLDVGLPTSISVSYDLSMVVLGTNTGDIVNFEITLTLLKSFHAKIKQYRETKSSNIELSVIEPMYIFPHGDEWHEGYIDGVSILGQDGVKDNTMNNKIVSRGVEDMEMLVWDPYESTSTDAAIDIALQWPRSNGDFGLKFKVVETMGQKVLIAGDYHGQVRIYNLGNGKRSRTLNDNSKEQFRPERILSHKLSPNLIIDVCCSNDHCTIVAVDHEHTVYLWVAAA